MRTENSHPTVPAVIQDHLALVQEGYNNAPVGRMNGFAMLIADGVIAQDDATVRAITEFFQAHNATYSVQSVIADNGRRAVAINWMK